MSLLTILFSLALAIAVIGLAYRLAIIYLIAPKVVRKYGVEDSRSRLWMLRVEKMCNRKILLGFVVVIIFCLFELTWGAIKARII